MKDAEMDLKVELEFRETQESKYRKNAAVQIAQEVEKCNPSCEIKQ